jgi:tetratricopeptide (TPR) repeat protein
MRWLDRIFGRPTPRDDGGDAVVLYDAHGTRHTVARREYGRKILPELLKNAWDDPLDLDATIVLALQNGFAEHALDPARRLRTIHPDRRRAERLYGLVLMAANQLAKAREVFEAYRDTHPPDATVLGALARIELDTGDRGRAKGMFREVLECFPNDPDALTAWGLLHRGDDTDEAGAERFYRSMEAIARVPGSWRPQLWLAQRAIRGGDVSGAKALYHAVLPLAQDHGDALMTITGDLGRDGHFREMLDLVLPVYRPSRASIGAGMNLVEACARVGEKRAGLLLVNDLLALDFYEHNAELLRKKARLEALEG